MNVSIDEIFILTVCVIAASVVILLGYKIYNSSLVNGQYALDCSLMVNVTAECMSDYSYVVILFPSPYEGHVFTVIVKEKGVARIEAP